MRNINVKKEIGKKVFALFRLSESFLKHLFFFGRCFNLNQLLQRKKKKVSESIAF